jgi:hypothetical protein
MDIKYAIFTFKTVYHWVTFKAVANLCYKAVKRVVIEAVHPHWESSGFFRPL